MAKTLRSGYTTGTCAAAAAKGAALALLGRQVEAVSVTTPQGRILTVPLHQVAVDGDAARCTVIKDAGDDPDITDGAAIVAEVSLQPHGTVIIAGGAGVGVVTKPGLAVPVGEPAINPAPRRMIEMAMRQVLPAGQGARVTIAIPGGEKLAARTLNPLLGIVGGLSVIGTTGIVEPMSEEAFKQSLTPQIDVARAAGYTSVVFVPGKLGQDAACHKFHLPADAVVQTSNFIGYMLEEAVERGVRQVMLFGQAGKLVKVAAGIFHTHSRMADARLETLAAYAGAAGAPAPVVRRILSCTTTEAAQAVLAEHGLTALWNQIARRASARAEQHVFGKLTVGTVIVDMQGRLLGRDATAADIGRDLAWQEP